MAAVALVTGAGFGIGKAAALALAAGDYRVDALGHTCQEISATADDISSTGGEGSR